MEHSRLNRLLKISLASLIVYFGLSKTPEILSKDNIYFDNKLIINDKQAEELYDLIEEETGKNTHNTDSTLILSAVYKNENLTEEEKNIILSFIDLIEENPYINKREAYAALKDLDIIYLDNEEEYDSSVMGVYIKRTNQIKIFTKEDSYDTLIHEIIHCLHSNYDNGYLPNYFIEGMTELLANEYFSTTPFVEDKSYPYEITMVKILCDMVGSDRVLNAYSTGDMNVIKEKLSTITSEEEAVSFLINVSNLFEEYEEGKTINSTNLNNVLSYMDKYFMKKSIEETESYPYHRGIISKIIEDNPGISYHYYLIDNGYFIKPYLSNKLKEEYYNHYRTDYSYYILEKI